MFKHQFNQQKMILLSLENSKLKMSDWLSNLRKRKNLLISVKLLMHSLICQNNGI